MPTFPTTCAPLHLSLHSAPLIVYTTLFTSFIMNPSQLTQSQTTVPKLMTQMQIKTIGMQCMVCTILCNLCEDSLVLRPHSGLSYANMLPHYKSLNFSFTVHNEDSNVAGSPVCLSGSGGEFQAPTQPSLGQLNQPMWMVDDIFFCRFGVLKLHPRITRLQFCLVYWLIIRCLQHPRQPVFIHSTN